MADKFELVVDGVPYEVAAEAFEFNSEKRFKVEYNGNEHIFTWDSSLGRMAPIDDDSIEIPDNLEVAIAERLQSARK